MNCEQLQHGLLEADSPGEPSAEMRRHLAECPSCRVWQSQLLQLEQQLPLLSVPPSQRKDEVIRLIFEAPEPASQKVKAPAYVPRHLFNMPPRERGLRKVSLAIAMAAALVVFAVGWWASQHLVSNSVGTDPLAARRVGRDRQLADAATATDRVQTVAKIADDVHHEALDLASKDDAEIVNASNFYIELVRDDLPQYALRLNPRLRPGVLPALKQNLSDMGSNLVRYLATSAKLSNRARTELQRMADETQKSFNRLQEIPGDEG
jgi:hypothetical protein